MPVNNKRGHALLICTISAVLAAAAGVRAAASPAFTLKGEVVDGHESPIAGASCSLAGPGLPGGRSLTTGDNGSFEFTGLTLSKYDLTCAAIGYKPVVQKGIEIPEGSSPFIQVVLSPEVVLRQEVEVKDKAPGGISPETTTQPVTFGAEPLRSLPLVEQKFLAALPLVPGVIRTPDGKINIKGVSENQGMLLIDSAETVDPVTGSFSIQVPIDAVESVEVHKADYQTQYGRFSGGLTSVQTKAPQDQWKWEINDFLPSVRIKSGHIMGISDDSPRVDFTGPLLKNKLNFSEYLLYDLNKQPVRGLSYPHNEIKKEGFESFTNLYYVITPQNLLTANLKVFPLRLQFADINSFIPQTASSDYAQRGYSFGATNRYLFSDGGVITTLFQYTDFDSYAHGQGPEDMVVTPDNWGGNFFNAWNRYSSEHELYQSYQSGKINWAGQHTIKLGGDYVHRSYSATNTSHPVDLLREDGSLAERITFQGSGILKARDTELALYGQDHWALNSQFALDYGLRFSGQSLGEHSAFAPRLGLAYSPQGNGRTIIRSGIGLFFDRLPLLAGDFTNNLDRVVTSYDTSGSPTGSPIVLRNYYQKRNENGVVVPSKNRLDSTPYNLTWNVELDQEIRPNLVARFSYLSSRSYDEFTVNPLYDSPIGPVMLLTNTGASRYHEMENTLHFKMHEKADFNISYIHSLGRGDLNTLAAVFVPLEQPVIRPNLFGTLPSNVPDRLVTWGRFKVPWGITASPVIDVHSGFPYSAVDALENYVGSPNSYRFPAHFSLDLQLSKDFQPLWIPVAKHHKFRGALRVFNMTNYGNYRDVHNNVTSPYFGEFAGFLHRLFDVSLDVLY